MSGKKQVVYTSNNSGGYWWLNDNNWRDLENAGWVVEWKGKDWNTAPDKCPKTYEEKVAEGTRWLGALATKATRAGKTLNEAITEWESIVGLDSTDEGCDCCGPPHYFDEEEMPESNETEQQGQGGGA